MAKKERSTFTVEPGRVILKNGETFLLVAVPSAFFANAPSASQDEADKITQRIAELLTEHGE